MKMSMRRRDYPKPTLTPEFFPGEREQQKRHRRCRLSRPRSNALTASSHPLLGCRSLRDKVLVLDGLAALDDRDRQEFSGLHREDRHFGVAAITLRVEG